MYYCECILCIFASPCILWCFLASPCSVLWYVTVYACVQTGKTPTRTMSGLEELELMKIKMNQWHKYGCNSVAAKSSQILPSPIISVSFVGCRGIKKELEEERKSLGKRRDYFQKKERSLRKRQTDYQQTSMAQKSHKRKQVSSM